MTSADTLRGRAALMVAHCAGLIDLVALPVWIGSLVAQFGFSPREAGALVTLFLAGAVVASVLVAPRMNRLNARVVAVAGFATAAVAFHVLASQRGFAAMASLHALAGFADGAALSVTHGTIGRAANPHRLFGIVGMAIGVFAVAFLATTPMLIVRHGGGVLFDVFSGVMVVGAMVALMAFPNTAPGQGSPSEGLGRGLSRAVWLGIVGVASMALVQAMAFGFLERAGIDRGFSRDAVSAVLVALGIVNLFPAGLAAVMEKRWTPRSVMLAGSALQGALVAVVMLASSFQVYAAFSPFIVAVMVFTHTFAFGFIARLDRSGRAVAATPAMLMTGAAIGPVLGGALVQASGYASLAAAAIAIDAFAIACFLVACARAADSSTMETAS
jgi:predicted MFS family arabinose efflux permease